MSVSIIRHDGAIIGLAPAPGNDQGLGVLTWFHLNKPAYSMDHAIRHEGYSVDAPEDLDCCDVESVINAICARAGVTMESTFVPFSQSRNAKPDSSMGDGKPWRSLNWRVTIKRGGREILTTDYAQGVGHVPNPDKLRSNLVTREIQENDAIETGKIRRGRTAFLMAIPTPSIGDVMQSLARDSDVLDSGGFESWASDYGYDTDSRKAESIYRECLEIATKLRAGLGGHLLAEVRLAASFN